MRIERVLGLLLCAVGAAACGDTNDDAGSGSGGSSASKPDSGTGPSSADVNNPDPINDDCPANDIGPTDGPYAQKGACCYRTSNKARLDKDASQLVLEYRLNYFMLINHRATIDPMVFGSTTTERFDNQEQSILFRFSLPQADGKVSDGPGKSEIGPGRYNCDGTFSFYSEKAASKDGGETDRWQAGGSDLDVMPGATDQRLVTAPFKVALESRNQPSYLPYLGPAPDFALDWEGVSQGFTLLEMPLAPDNYDCVGSRKSGNWKPAGKSAAYGRLDLNDKDKIDALNITFCQLMAFGATADAPDCLATPRCMPGDGNCKWKRLPDSLCPVTDDEKARWGCHLGYGGNPDNDPVKMNCSKDAPTKDVDPDKGTAEGQCCDPLGGADSGLPACNAWLQINEFTAAAVDITDKPSDTLQPSCHNK